MKSLELNFKYYCLGLFPWNDEYRSFNVCFPSAENWENIFTIINVWMMTYRPSFLQNDANNAARRFIWKLCASTTVWYNDVSSEKGVTWGQTGEGSCVKKSSRCTTVAGSSEFLIKLSHLTKIKSSKWWYYFSVNMTHSSWSAWRKEQM